jgi:hypothetical protein
MPIYKINYKITHDRQTCVRADSEREAYEKAREELELQDPFAIEIGDITEIEVKASTGFLASMRKCSCMQHQQNIAEMNECACKRNRGYE